MPMILVRWLYYNEIRYKGLFYTVRIFCTAYNKTRLRLLSILPNYGF